MTVQRPSMQGPIADTPPGSVIWITGLSGAGKSTVAWELSGLLRHGEAAPVLLDGDQLRAALDARSFDDAGRRRLAFVYARLCRLLAMQGHTVICATIALYHEVQAWNRDNLPGYLEVLLDVPMQELIRRDTKGVYRGQRDHSEVWGLGLRPEFPISPDLVIHNVAPMTSELAARDIADRLAQRPRAGHAVKEATR
jgi:adenylylsulfate kinase-like enzyme